MEADTTALFRIVEVPSGDGFRPLRGSSTEAMTTYGQNRLHGEQDDRICISTRNETSNVKSRWKRTVK